MRYALRGSHCRGRARCRAGSRGDRRRARCPGSRRKRRPPPQDRRSSRILLRLSAPNSGATRAARAASPASSRARRPRATAARSGRAAATTRISTCRAAGSARKPDRLQIDVLGAQPRRQQIDEEVKRQARSKPVKTQISMRRLNSAATSEAGIMLRNQPTRTARLKRKTASPPQRFGIMRPGGPQRARFAPARECPVQRRTPRNRRS